jgi:hypothetical protein
VRLAQRTRGATSSANSSIDDRTSAGSIPGYWIRTKRGIEVQFLPVALDLGGDVVEVADQEAVFPELLPLGLEGVAADGGILPPVRVVPVLLHQRLLDHALGRLGRLRDVHLPEEGDLSGAAVGRLALVADVGDLPAREVERDVPAEEAVGDASAPSDARLVARADPDRRPRVLDRLRTDGDVLELEVLALVADRVLRPEPLDDFDALDGPSGTVRAVDAERVVLGLTVAETDPEPEPPAVRTSTVASNSAIRTGLWYGRRHSAVESRISPTASARWATTASFSRYWWSSVT